PFITLAAVPLSSPLPAKTVDMIHAPMGTAVQATGASTLLPGGVARRQWLITVATAKTMTTAEPTDAHRLISSLRGWSPSTPNTLGPRGNDLMRSGCQVGVVVSRRATAIRRSRPPPADPGGSAADHSGTTRTGVRGALSTGRPAPSRSTLPPR